jgi:D-amino-acid oxidase
MAVRITVVGAGVVGLSSAIRLAEHGYQVDVLARDLPAETTSASLAGLWLPAALPAGPGTTPARTTRPGAATDHAEAAGSDPRASRWARRTLVELTALAAVASTGVRLMRGTLLHARPVPPPAWAAPPDPMVPLQACARPLPGYAFGYRGTLPVVDGPAYLTYLRDRLVRAGGTLTRLPLAALPPRGVVVNCTGLSARALVPDPLVGPIRAQVVLVGDPGLPQWYWDGETAGRPLWVLPRGRDVVVGATAEPGAWDTAPDEEAGRRLLARACSAVPALRDAPVLGHRVGLLPGRPVVRLEVERRPDDSDPDHAVVHCYGHGADGLTLSWGCADAVLAEVGTLVPA